MRFYQFSNKKKRRDYFTGDFYLYFFNNSDPNPTQIQFLTLKPTPNITLAQTLTQAQILTLNNEEMNFSRFRFIIFNL